MKSVEARRPIARLVAPLIASLLMLASVNSVAIGRPDETLITVELAGGQKLQGFQGAFSVPENRRKESGRLPDSGGNTLLFWSLGSESNRFRKLLP